MELNDVSVVGEVVEAGESRREGRKRGGSSTNKEFV